MNKSVLGAAIAALAISSGTVSAQSAGDVAFTSFNSQEDGWSLVALASLAPNTTIFFSDNEWNGSAIGSGGAFNSGESFHQWVTGANSIVAGTVVRFRAVDSATNLAASIGTFTRASVTGSTNYGVSTSADTVYAYLGGSASAPTSFLAAISSGGFTVTDGQLANTGLTAGVNAVQLANSTLFSEYTNVRNGQAAFADYLPGLTTITGNWSTSVSNAAAVPNTTAFTITPVPEPEVYAMFLAGLGLLGAMARRRRAQ